MHKLIRITVAALAVATFFSLAVIASAANPPLTPPVKPAPGSVQPKHDNKTPPNMKDKNKNDQPSKDQSQKDKDRKAQAKKDQAEINVGLLKDQVGRDTAALGAANVQLASDVATHPDRLGADTAQIGKAAAKLDESQRLLDQAQRNKDKANK